MPKKLCLKIYTENDFSASWKLWSNTSTFCNFICSNVDNTVTNAVNNTVDNNDDVNNVVGNAKHSVTA